MSYSKRSMNSNDSDDEDYNINNISNRAIRSNSKTNSLQQINSNNNNNNGNKNYRNKNRTDSEEEDDNNSNSYQRTTNYRRKLNRNYDDEDDDDDNEENYQPRHSRQGSFRKPTNERSSSFVPRHIEQDDQRHYQKQQRNGSQTDNSWVNGRRTDELRNSDENGKAWTQAKSRSSTRRPQSDEDDDDDEDNNRNNYGRRSKVNRQQNDFDIENSYEETGTSRTRQVKPPKGERSYRNNNNVDNDDDDDDNYNYHNSRSVNRNDRDNQSRSGSNSSRRQQNRSDYNNGDEDDDNNNNYNNYKNNNNNNYNNNNRSKSGNSNQSPNNHNNHNNELVRRDERQAHLGRSNDTDEEDMLSDDGADIIKQEHDLKDRDMNDGVMRLGSNIPLVLLCPPNGGSTDLVECLILRDRSGVTSSLYPTYKLYLERNMKLLLVAQKMNLNTTSNYHLFDLSRGTVGGSLSKKSGNYLGKLRALDTNRTEYAVVTRSEEREEVAGILFERISIVNQLKEGCQPRKMTVLLPNLNAESEPIPHQVNSSKNGKKSLVDMIKNSENGRMFLLKSKEPVFENGNYRLNFHGRVSVPSVKNFQLSSPDDPTHVVCQFGKIGEDRFHLDYKAPLNAFQAFGLALCHFDT